MTDPRSAVPSLAAIARESGTFAMVAMDQRESLRTMFDDAGAGRPGDEVLTRFKLDVGATLGPFASGFLIDREFGFEAVRADGFLPPGCGLILAADSLQQEAGGPVQETEVDEAVVAADADLAGVAAIKLLVIWRRDDRRAHRVEMARRFIAAARQRGVLSVLEPVVRATSAELAEGSWDTDEAIREAARELSALGSSLYKVQVPRSGRGTPEELRSACEQLGEAITGPWVVLSQGVDLQDFAKAVTAACQAGASGFLAGRALWSDAVGQGDVATRLRELSVPRLQRLVEIVDQHARPWSAAGADGVEAQLRIGLLHTVPALAGTFQDLVSSQEPGAGVVHIVDPQLLATTIVRGVTDEVQQRVTDHARHLADGGAAVVMVTCSSVGEAAEAAGSTSAVPVLRVDAAMAAEAVAVASAPGARGRIAVLATLASTLGPTKRLVEREVHRAGSRIEVVSSVVPGAAAARAAGDLAGHDTAIADAIRELSGGADDGADVVVLAQASMAPAASAAAADGGATVLSSPASGVTELLRVTRGAARRA